MIHLLSVGWKKLASMLSASFTVIFEKLWGSRELQEMKGKENTTLYLNLQKRWKWPPENSTIIKVKEKGAVLMAYIQITFWEYIHIQRESFLRLKYKRKLNTKDFEWSNISKWGDLFAYNCWAKQFSKMNSYYLSKKKKKKLENGKS